MRVLNVSLENFASYGTLEFSFENKGLSLIHGPNGAGKSTLCDAIPWILFGRTAKNGSVDEILSWPGDKNAKGTAVTDTITVTRTRGPSGNDLYYQTPHESPKRGKDLLDTQKQINAIIGMDCETYLTAAYFHEFSATASFFTASAKNRRLLCEQLVDLTLAKKLQTGIEIQKKTLKVSATLPTELEAAVSRKAELTSILDREEARATAWADRQKERFAVLKQREASFDKERAKAVAIASILEKRENDDRDKRVKELEHRLGHPTTCGECGSPKSLSSADKAKLTKEIKRLKTTPNPHSQAIDRELTRENTYAQQLEALNLETNPHQDEANRLSESVSLAGLKVWSLTARVDEYNQKLADINLLAEVTEYFRSASVKRTIVKAEELSNQMLNDYFDAEIRVRFEVEAADKVEVSIFKDGNSCSYTQLSKGQRQLLKLCFGVSAMRLVAQHYGFGLNTVAFDEALDGLSEEMKAKAFRLLQSLETDYETILVVDHSEGLKALFSNRYRVDLQDGKSQINEEV